MSGCHNNGEFLIDTCDPNHSNNPVFNVLRDEKVVLRVAGLPDGVEVNVLQILGNINDDIQSPLAVNGATAHLSSENTIIEISAEGTYTLDLSQIPDGACVYIEAEDVPQPEEGCCGPFSPAAEPPKPDSVEYVETGLYTDGEPCYKVLAQVACVAGAQLPPPYPLGYIDTTGDFIVTTSGFTPQKPTINNDVELAYETLATGAVNKLQEIITIEDGIKQPSTYVLFGTDTVYVPADLTLVGPKPSKVQMAEFQLEVTGASTALGTNVVPVANVNGELFPSHAVIHVNADADGAGAGIAYTTDGTDPANSATAIEFEVSAGTSFTLDTHEEIINLRMIAIGAAGDADATATSVDVSVELNNISPDKDDI